MEENTESVAVATETEAKSSEVAPVVEQVESVHVSSTVSERPLRKNGRNRSGSQKSKSTSAACATESCGEVTDLTSFTEKLSGSNVQGYGDAPEGEEAPRAEKPSRGPRNERREKGERRKRFEQNREAVEEKSEETSDETKAEVVVETLPESQHAGPAFEEKKFAPRAIEVGLTDRRPKKFSNEKSDDGVVSMTSEDCSCPPISFFARVKEIFKSIFGKKSAKKDFSKKGGKKKWDKKGGNRHYNSHGKFRKNDHRGHRRYNDRRPK